MNDLVKVEESKVPAFLKKKKSRIADQALQGVRIGLPFPRISTRASRFRLVDGGTETVMKTLELEVVIIGASPGITKTYYEDQWTDDGDPIPPSCFSLDGERPDPAVSNPVSDLCSTCPNNMFGSRVTEQGTKAKACSDTKRLAVVPADQPDGPVAMLSVSPAALRGFAQYVSQLTQHGVPLEGAVTTLSFDEKASYPKLVFSFGGFVDEDSFTILSERVVSDPVAAQIVGSDPVVVTENAAAEAETEAVEQKPKPKPKPKATPKAKQEPEPEAEEATAFGGAETTSEPEGEDVAGEESGEDNDALMAKLNAILQDNAE